MTSKELGPNAQSFSDHVCAGLEAGGLDSDDYAMSIVADQETGEMGFLMSQVPMAEICDEHLAVRTSSLLICWEDRISWPSDDDAAHLAINEQQPVSMCAVLFLSAMLTGSTVPAQKCEECEE